MGWESVLTSLTWSTIYTLDGELESLLAKARFKKFTNAPRQKIFDVVTNYESLQTRLPEFFPSIRVISERSNATLVEEHLVLAGKEFVVMAKHVVNEPFLHEIFIVGGDVKGTHITEEFEQTPKGVQITVCVDFKPKGTWRLLNLFKKGNIENEFSRIMDRLIWIAEN